ncbi:hypothetical protein HOLleu_13247 [Holothuria leucospilota]|uniref:Uncharacterized protein n=1 Tax=Holothuria leucospilota TaxID=206669 RepID=A0A9Q1HEJ2_HOLLE|nr:hypothetical protein HOLleu_13247 [Holothuria leucospilota]
MPLNALHSTVLKGPLCTVYKFFTSLASLPPTISPPCQFARNWKSFRPQVPTSSSPRS